MNILAFILGWRIAQNEGADEHAALRGGLLGALLPMPLGLVIAAAAGRSVTAGGDKGSKEPTKPEVKSAADARRAIDSAWRQTTSEIAAVQSEAKEALLVGAAQHVVDAVWEQRRELEQIAAEVKQMAEQPAEQSAEQSSESGHQDS